LNACWPNQPSQGGNHSKVNEKGNYDQVKRRCLSRKDGRLSREDGYLVKIIEDHRFGGISAVEPIGTLMEQYGERNVAIGHC
jgi:hypothetical protein